MPNFIPNRAERRALERENAKLLAKQGNAFAEIPGEDWPDEVRNAVNRPNRVFRSAHFLVQVFPAPEPAFLRLSVLRTSMKEQSHRWADGITWDELQDVKDRLGLAKFEAVEIYPRAVDVVNVANIRHLWVLKGLLPFTWRDDRQEPGQETAPAGSDISRPEVTEPDTVPNRM